MPVVSNVRSTGMTAGGVESLYRGQTKFETPHLAIKYKPNKESTFWRT